MGLAAPASAGGWLVHAEVGDAGVWNVDRNDHGDTADVGLANCERRDPGDTVDVGVLDAEWVTAAEDEVAVGVSNHEDQDTGDGTDLEPGGGSPAAVCGKLDPLLP